MSPLVSPGTGRPRRWVVCALALWGAIWCAGALAQTWEFRVCAQPFDYPASSRDDHGFLNDIAELLADELGAELTYEWSFLNDETIATTLLAGTCDAVIGIGENVAGVTNTVPFLRVPYVFVTRAEDEIEIESLDDPVLADLTIGTYPAGVPSLALRHRGLEANVRAYPPVSAPGGPDSHAAILDGLVSGEVDVAIVFGLAATARAAMEATALRIVPVSPEIDTGPSVLQLFRVFTIGVRPNDVVFRERLNAALAARWVDVQAAIDSYGVDTLSVVRPSSEVPAEGPVVRVGVVTPHQAGEFNPLEIVGEAARLGAELARNYLAVNAGSSDVRFEVVTANAPGVAATVRAAERLAVTEGVIAIAGGFDVEQATALADMAAERGIVFLNVGSSDESLRLERCDAATFHVEASESMYLDAVVTWYASAGPKRWYLIHEATDGGEFLAGHAAASLSAHGDGQEIVGTSAVRPGQLAYANEIKTLLEQAPDVVVVMLNPQDSFMFMGQIDGRASGATVVALPQLAAQTRQYLAQLGAAAPSVAGDARPALWETTLAEGPAAEIIDRFESRTGQPMESAAWSTYAAVLLVHQAALHGAAFDQHSLVAFLSDPDSVRSDELGKGPGVSFRAWNHQLRQPLYMVEIQPDAAWGLGLGQRLGVARSLGTVPEVEGTAQSVDTLDRLGVGPQEGRCG